MKKIIVEISYSKTINIDDEVYNNLKQENFSGQIKILEEHGIDSTNIQYVDFNHKYNNEEKGK